MNTVFTPSCENLSWNRSHIISILLNSYQSYYNIQSFEDSYPLIARCDYFEHAQKYVMSQKAELWSADTEEFIYLYETSHFTLENFMEWKTFVLSDGFERMHIGPGHMYSYLTLVVICDTASEEALRALKKFRYSKSFHFSLHGWMDYRSVLVLSNTQKIVYNSAGRTSAKMMKKIVTVQK